MPKTPEKWEECIHCKGTGNTDCTLCEEGTHKCTDCGGTGERWNISTEEVRAILTADRARIEQGVEGLMKDEVKWKKAKYDVKSVDAVLYNRALADVKKLIHEV